MPKNTARPDSATSKKLYVALLRSDMVRDVQFCATANNDFDSEDWKDLEQADLYLGAYFGTSDAARQAAAEYGCTIPENIRLLEIPQVIRVV